VEKRTSLKIACIEEIAFRMKYIDAFQLQEHIKSQGKSAYGKYLENLIK
jgi:glucose-1-phosphate thymidylyltransferase